MKRGDHHQPGGGWPFYDEEPAREVLASCSTMELCCTRRHEGAHDQKYHHHHHQWQQQQGRTEGERKHCRPNSLVHGEAGGIVKVHTDEQGGQFMLLVVGVDEGHGTIARADAVQRHTVLRPVRKSRAQQK